MIYVQQTHHIQYKQNRDAVCMSEIEWMDEWMQAGMRQWVDQWMKNLMNKAREKSESNMIEWINGMTLQDMEWELDEMTWNDMKQHTPTRNDIASKRHGWKLKNLKIDFWWP